MEFEGLSPESVSMQHLERYMAAVGAEYAGPYGRPWREGKKPYSQSSLDSAAACLKGFYRFQGTQGIHQELAAMSDRSRLPTKADRRRMFLGHVAQEVPANPLRPTRRVRRRHPKMLADGARETLIGGLQWARNRMIMTWLGDGGFRVGELCGLHLVDLHLREGADCGECTSPHVHICHREFNPNRSRAKIKEPWAVEGGVVTGGQIRRASPAMIHTYFEYLTMEYPASATHGMLLVQLKGHRRGEPLSPAGVRQMMGRAGRRLGLGRTNPHGLRHEFATAVLDATNGNMVIARDAGGWASAKTVEETYGHTDLHSPVFMAALDQVWGES
ncbi:tyrosine-type recombinase/integrase [Streptomyces sp. F001]|uniref:tyrosine-type recombinase/integrase n=1 Tax=Streptomyces sp. F001 TaxID=1510026 RepID=UPI001F0DC467|nr:tyrosine-type recombinase/integrase [Streptomyces sp. F001]